jgi:TRAP-type C4-dicarboxylate transport system substrate-binding protein
MTPTDRHPTARAVTAALTARTCMLAAALTAALVIALALVASRPAGAQTVELRMHTHVPPVSSSYKSLTWWTEEVAKASGGALKVTLFGNMQLGGKAEDVFSQTERGIVDIGWTLPGYVPGRFPRLSVFELPFIGAAPTAASPAVHEYGEKWLKEELGMVRVLALHSPTNLVLHMKDKPIRRLEDMKGVKMRTPSRIASEAFNQLGAVPVAIPGLSMTEALMRGVVEGAATPWAIANAIRTVDAAKYHTEVDLNQVVLSLIINKDSYAKLSAAHKAAIDKTTGLPLSKEFGRRWQRDDGPAIARARELKHEIIKLPAAEEARWVKATQPVIDGWIKEMAEKGHPARELVSDARALIAKYKAEAAKTN